LITANNPSARYNGGVGRRCEDIDDEDDGADDDDEAALVAFAATVVRIRPPPISSTVRFIIIVRNVVARKLWIPRNGQRMMMVAEKSECSVRKM
jgi:hypothetical protein